MVDLVQVMSDPGAPNCQSLSLSRSRSVTRYDHTLSHLASRRLRCQAMTRVPILWPPPRLRDRLSLLAHRIYQIRQAVCDRLVLEDASCDIPFLTIIGQGLTVDWLSKERICQGMIDQSWNRQARTVPRSQIRPRMSDGT